ncbi:hypothetical protein F53441_66 [Fusarium austroafricanum]|uniref:Uncharacterized protein n=1 Tax=Fusarium austroafricanum TaxID=2364996 RepID=A0A8H4P6Q0_9HYPO|nr:hypothetical protein F53441_66 [Fusarium austroafricanum]
MSVKTLCERDMSRLDMGLQAMFPDEPSMHIHSLSIAGDELWGNEPPHLNTRAKTSSGLSQFPTGPHRKLAFHRPMSLQQLTTPTRVREPFIWVADSSIQELQPDEVDDSAVEEEEGEENDD